MNFEALRRQRHEAGIKEHRGGDEAAPFVGDPLVERLHELADAENYQRVAARQAGLPDDPRAWPEGWYHEWCQVRECAEWTIRRLRERDARTSGGIAWSCGNIAAD